MDILDIFTYSLHSNFSYNFRIFNPSRELTAGLKECQHYLYPRAECRLATRANLRTYTIISLGVRTRGFGLPVKQAISSSCYVTSARLGQYLMSWLICSCALLLLRALSFSPLSLSSNSFGSLVQNPRHLRFFASPPHRIHPPEAVAAV